MAGCGMIGPQELLIVLGILVVVMGAGRLPQIGDALGRSFLNFKRAVKGADEIDVTPRDKQVGPGEDAESDRDPDPKA